MNMISDHVGSVAVLSCFELQYTAPIGISNFDWYSASLLGTKIDEIKLKDNEQMPYVHCMHLREQVIVCAFCNL